MKSIKFLTACAMVVGALAMAACAAPDEPADTGGTPNEQPASTPAPQEALTDLVIEDLVEGQGQEAKAGDVVAVHYTGWLLDGTKFDSSLDGGHPYQFVLGQGTVIEGWDRGLVGMKVGGKRKLTIPPQFGYGDQPVGPIPAGSTLVFEVELISIGQ